MSEQETLEWLKSAFSRTRDEKLVDKDYTRLVSDEINLNTPEIQSYMMSNW